MSRGHDGGERRVEAQAPPSTIVAGSTVTDLVNG